MIVNERDVQSLIEKDKLFGDIFDRLATPPNWTRPPGFTSIAKIILEQQVSLSSANAHFSKLNGFITAFTPENILKLSDAEMRSCQISRQKSRYLRELSAEIMADPGFLEHLTKIGEPAARERLMRIKGIGAWTADVYLMFCLEEKDVFPVGDIALITTVRELTSAQTKEEMTALAERWRPLRSLATYFLWHHYLRKRNRHVPAGGYSPPVDES